MEHIKVYLVCGLEPAHIVRRLSDVEFKDKSYKSMGLLEYSMYYSDDPSRDNIRFIADPSYRTIRVYKFSELSEATQNKVIADMSSINTDGIWWLSIYHSYGMLGVRVDSFDLHTKEVVLSVSDLDGTADIMITKLGSATVENKAALIYDKTGDKNAFIKQIRTDLLSKLQTSLANLKSARAISQTIKERNYMFMRDGSLFKG